MQLFHGDRSKYRTPISYYFQWGTYSFFPVGVIVCMNFTFSGESEFNSAPPPVTASHHQKGFANLGFY